MAQRRLTLKQERFIELYCTPGLETFGNGVASAIAAGYKGNNNIVRSIAAQNLTKLSIQEAIANKKAALSAKNEVKVEYIQSEHRRLARLAESKGDISNATRNVEDLGKTVGAYQTVIKGELDLFAGQRPDGEAVRAAVEASRRRIESFEVDKGD